ncbi:MAG TPA: Flp family type IVb pilin [Pseudolabrys sp.]|nr:Flp family type IVb pilin [Pseudolabrys sp.]
MSRFKTFRPFLRSDRGATAIEYALIASGVAGVLVAAIVTLGGSLSAMWVTISHLFATG